MNANYWQTKIGRRRMLRGAGIGATGVAAAALIGCSTSGGDTAGSGPVTSSTAAPAVKSMMATVADTSGSAVKGGIYKAYQASDTPSWDPHASNSTIGVAGNSAWAYPLLFEMAPTIAGKEPATPVQGQLIESHEFNDKTTLTLKIRQNAKWDADAPTSSRKVDAQDVVFSWNRFAANSLNRSSLANKVSGAAPIVSVTAIDANTVQIKTAFPSGILLPLLANQNAFQILPREADGGFNPATTVRGAGPWKLTRRDPDVRIEWRRNPNYWRTDRPFLDGVDIPIISDPSQQLSQFRSGNVWSSNTGASPVIQADVISTKKEFPALEVYEGDGKPSPFHFSFGLRPGSPYRDVRVRRAVSMLLDRRAIVDVFDNAQDFAKAGWPIDINFPNVGIAKAAGAAWLDPNGKEMTAEGKSVFQFNRDEAMKLLNAAGIGTYKTDMIIIRDRYGPEWPRIAESFLAELNATGKFKVNPVTPPSWAEWTRDYFYANGDFEGIAFCTSVDGLVPAQHLLETYHSGGTYQHGAFKRDPKSIEGLAESDALIEKIAQSIDFKEQVELMHKWQVQEAPWAHVVESPNKSSTRPFELLQPWTKNVGSWRTLGNMATTKMANAWISDDAKRK